MGKTRGHGTRKGGASSGRSRGGRGGGRPAKDGAASDFESGSDSDRGAEDKTAKVKRQGELLAFQSAQTRSDSLEILANVIIQNSGAKRGSRGLRGADRACMEADMHHGANAHSIIEVLPYHGVRQDLQVPARACIFTKVF